MNILYLTSAFPKPQDGATIYTDLAEELKLSHNIEVVVADQNIPILRSVSNIERNIMIHRIGIFSYYNVGFIKKGLSALTQSLFLKKVIYKIIKMKTIDLILYESPPTTNARLIQHLKKKTKSKTYLMLKDIFPQNAVDLDVLTKKSLLYRYFRIQEKRLYRISDIIGCMSQANVDYVIGNNDINSAKVKIFPNTKKIKDLIRENNDFTEFFITNAIPLDKKIVLFGGNMGKPQNITLLSKLIFKFKDNSMIHFLCIGRGQEKKYLEKMIRDYSIKNATILDSLHRNLYESILHNVSVGLILLSEKFTIPNYPSRILSYMEYGIPVFAATDTYTDIKELIIENHFGLWANSASIEEVEHKFTEMINLKNLKDLGKNGQIYVKKNLDVSKSVKLIEKHYKELI